MVAMTLSVVSAGMSADSGAKSPSRMLILGVCLGIGVLVVITILAVVVLRTNIRKREREIGHRYYLCFEV